ncbi:carboxypeptidase-like regulatory domain-containing protein [Salinirubrum litoreum]|uniref:Carboxypeptidase-like regulatory domain-containing protein n=1 Tax=Salinirubrum litoreum TaxID=1126234 RepID=A0ABD5R5X2_9EURY|nr:carboxypeptidase-like regulatory domain-containing protein [Salinirubrum litoreum]
MTRSPGRTVVFVVTALLVSSVVAVPLLAAPASAQSGGFTVVVTDDTGERLADATVNASWGGERDSKTTTSNGTVVFDVPRGETVFLTVTHPDFASDEQRVVSDTGDPARIEFRTTGTLVVTASAGGERLANARVTLTDEEANETILEGRTGDDGRFTSETIPQGVYNVTVSRTGYFAVEERVAVYGRTTVDTQHQRGSIELRVRVVDPYFSSPEPVAEANVRYDAYDGDTTTGNGVVRLLAPLNSRDSLIVEKEGYQTIERTISVGESPRDLTVTLSRTPTLDTSLSATSVEAGESVTLTVRNAYDDPVTGATVSLDGEEVATTDNGTAEFAVPPGEHEVVVATDETETTLSVTGEGTPTATVRSEPTPTPSATPEAPTTETTGPGFGVLAAVVGLLGLILLAVGGRHRSR